MPTYEYACDRCGNFELWRNHRDAAQGASCPRCASDARRVFFAPATRTPRNMLLMAGAGREGRDRIVRAHTGEPKVISGPPKGTRVSGGLNGPLHIHGHRHAPSRPWQVGHC
jgi:putative FmdB family regulatory protein